MEEIGKAIVAMIDKGMPLAGEALRYWYFVRAIDSLVGLLQTIFLTGGILLLARMIIQQIKWYYSTIDQSR